jgi:nitrous oxide reductase accessory protein NosL
MTSRVGPVVALVVAVFASSVVGAAPGSGDVEPRRPGERDTCPVCGMFVVPYPAWIAQIVFTDGSVSFFDGSKDLFTYLADRDRYLPGKTTLGIERVFVTSYYETEFIPARTAHFVVGSDVIGPMGYELVPHASREEAEEFMEDHGGTAVVGFDDVTPALLRSTR